MSVQDTAIPAHQTSTILVIDADPLIGDNLAQHFGTTDVQVLVAQTGTQGYWLALSQQPKAVVTDLSMRNESGLQMLECLKDNSHTEQIPIVVLTGQEYPGMHQHLEGLGAAAVLRKPQPADHLGSIIQQVMADNAVC